MTCGFNDYFGSNNTPGNSAILIINLYFFNKIKYEETTTDMFLKVLIELCDKI